MAPVTTRERCARCGGPFDLARDAVVPVWRCRDCWREVPATALSSRTAWREHVLRVSALVPPLVLLVLVALGVVP